MGAAGALVAGTVAGRAGWIRLLDGAFGGQKDLTDSGPIVLSQWLDYHTLQDLLDASEAVVLGTLESVEEYSLPTIARLGAEPSGRSSGQWLSIKVAEVLKGGAPLAGTSLRIAHNTESEDYYEDEPAIVTHNGALTLHLGATVVAFLTLDTAPDGSRPWGFTGEPGVAEVEGGRLVFAASKRFVASLADDNLTLAKGGGHAPFAVALDEVREAAPKSLDPSVVDPPRTSDNRPTQAPQPPSDKPTPRADQFPTPKP